jgi:hypothetical protein
LFDVFDGNYWSNFKKDGLPFVLQPGSLMLSLNVDWFSPTKTMNYSVGAIYLIVISGAKDEGYNLKYNNKRIDSKWNQLS